MGSLPTAAPLIRLFIAGGSYAGLSTALNLNDIVNGVAPRMAREPFVHNQDLPRPDLQITIVDERDGFLHLIGCPLALADANYAKKAWVQFKDVPALQAPNIKVVHGSVSNVDPANKTATVVDGVTKASTTHSYDYFIAASGLRRVWPVVPQSLTRKQYLAEADAHINAVANAQDGVLVVGGGAVGIEMAAELKLITPNIKVTLAHSRDKLLSSEGLPDETKDKALELLQEGGVETLMSHRLAKSEKVETADGSTKYEIEFTNGHKMTANLVIMAISKSVPSTSFMPPALLDEEGYIKIQPNLKFDAESPNADYHFCGGDAARWSGIKRCGAAMHHGNLIAQNIYQNILKDVISAEPKLHEMVEVPPMIGLAVGKKAVAYGPDVGTSFGADVMEVYFRDDLGFTICWDWMQLGKQAVVA